MRFEVDAPADLEVSECNCSICSRTAFLHLIVPRQRFRLLTPRAALTSYRFHTGTAEHLFCPVCGIKSFYVPRSNPDGIDVNVRCLDEPPREMTIEPFDGREWEKHGAELAHLSKEG